MFENITAAPADPILGLADLFRADDRPGKINLGIGVYKDETGKTPELLQRFNDELKKVCDEISEKLESKTANTQKQKATEGYLVKMLQKLEEPLKKRKPKEIAAIIDEICSFSYNEEENKIVERLKELKAKYKFDEMLALVGGHNG